MNLASEQDKLDLKAAIASFSYRENFVEQFTLVSGKKSPYYFDLKQTLLQPHFLHKTALCLLDLVHEKLGVYPTIMSGLTMGADPMLYACALLAETHGIKIYPVIIRKNQKEHGSKKRAEGAFALFKHEKTCVLIDDVITTGGSTLQAFEAVTELGLEARHAFCVLDRFEGGAEALEEKGIKLHPLFTLDDFRSR